MNKVTINYDNAVFLKRSQNCAIVQQLNRINSANNVNFIIISNFKDSKPGSLSWNIPVDNDQIQKIKKDKPIFYLSGCGISKIESEIQKENDTSKILISFSNIFEDSSDLKNTSKINILAKQICKSLSINQTCNGNKSYPEEEKLNCINADTVTKQK